MLYRLVFGRNNRLVCRLPSKHQSFIWNHTAPRKKKRKKKKMSRFSLHRSGKRHVRPHCNLQFTIHFLLYYIMPWMVENILNQVNPLILFIFSLLYTVYTGKWIFPSILPNLCVWEFYLGVRTGRTGRWFRLPLLLGQFLAVALCYVSQAGAER